MSITVTTVLLSVDIKFFILAPFFNKVAVLPSEVLHSILVEVVEVGNLPIGPPGVDPSHNGTPPVVLGSTLSLICHLTPHGERVSYHHTPTIHLRER